MRMSLHIKRRKPAQKWRPLQQLGRAARVVLAGAANGRRATCEPAVGAYAVAVRDAAMVAARELALFHFKQRMLHTTTDREVVARLGKKELRRSWADAVQTAASTAAPTPGVSARFDAGGFRATLPALVPALDLRRFGVVPARREAAALQRLCSNNRHRIVLQHVGVYKLGQRLLCTCIVERGSHLQRRLPAGAHRSTVSRLPEGRVHVLRRQ